MSVEWVILSNHLILYHLLLLLPSVFASISVFSSESSLCIRWPKYWSFSFSISLSKKYSGLIFFMIADQGTRALAKAPTGMVWESCQQQADRERVFCPIGLTSTSDLRNIHPIPGDGPIKNQTECTEAPGKRRDQNSIIKSLSINCHYNHSS